MATQTKALDRLSSQAKSLYVVLCSLPVTWTLGDIEEAMTLPGWYVRGQHTRDLAKMVNELIEAGLVVRQYRRGQAELYHRMPLPEEGNQESSGNEAPTADRYSRIGMGL